MMLNKKRSKPSYRSYPFVGHVVEVEGKNKIELYAPQNYHHFLRTVCKPRDEVSMYITNKKPKRSLAQNNYMHLYFSLIAMSSGHTMEEIKTWAKGKLLTKGIKEIFGDKVRMVRGTSDLRIGECLEFLAALEAETEVPLPKTEPFLHPLSQKEYDALKENQKQIYSRITANLNIK